MMKYIAVLNYCFARGLIVCTSRDRPGLDRAGLLDAGRRSAAEEKEVEVDKDA
jgi:hypothetical protein